MILLTIEITIAVLASIGAAIVYFGYQEWYSNQYTISTATIRLGLSLILCYVEYNVLGRFFHWPVLTGTWIAQALYGIVMVMEVFCFITFVRYTVKQRSNNVR